MYGYGEEFDNDDNEFIEESGDHNDEDEQSENNQ